MNTRISWNKRQWLEFVGILVIVAVGVWFIIFKYPIKTVRQELPTPAFAIKEYSLSGKITAINGNVITLNVGRVFVGDKGNYVAYEDKVVTVTDKTVITLVTNTDGKMVRKPGAIKDLTVGSKIVVYSDSNIALQDSFTPTRLDINL